MRSEEQYAVETMTVERDIPDDASMSFGDHLEELRRRIFLALAAPLPISIVIFFVSAGILDIILRPLYRTLEANDLPGQVQVLSPPEVLVTRLKISIIVALVISAPWMLWQAWKFISPGLFQHERRFVYFLVPGSAILTTAGVCLLYFAMLPLILQVLVMFGATLRAPAVALPAGPPDLPVGSSFVEVREDHPPQPSPGQMWLKSPENILHIAIASRAGEAGAVELLRLPLGHDARVAQQFRLSEYISFVLLLLLGMVIAFQMPLVILLLGWLGLASATWLRRQRRFAVLICAVVAAVITPADAISMIAMLIPLYALYELGILLLVLAPASRVAEGRVLDLRPRREESDDASDRATRRPSQGTSVPRGETPDGETGSEEEKDHS